MKKTLVTIAVSVAVAAGGALLFGLDPVETGKLIAGMFGA